MTNTSLALVVKKTLAASPERVFNAWTHKEALKKWWGPKGVTCHDADIDLRVGGKYQIGNTLPDGNVVWIRGQFVAIETNKKLVYTWGTDAENSDSERVTVKFKPMGETTEVTVIHEKIATQALLEQHTQGWEGCLAGLAGYEFESA
ncbi:SRPBCC domain-containing protein [Reinekea forsetii]|nr:SRPBCC domain-containing protein [Reinekea forsetii]